MRRRRLVGDALTVGRAPELGACTAPLFGRGRAPSLAAGVALLIAACGGSDPVVPVVTDDVLIVTQSPGLSVFLQAQYEGEVVLDQAGCFRLDLVAPENATVVWPAGTRLFARGDRLELQDGSGRRIVALGLRFRFGGGFVASLDEVTDLSAEQRATTRERCPGPYWLLKPGTARALPG